MRTILSAVAALGFAGFVMLALLGPAIAPHDPLYEKTVSNMQEVAARGGRIVLIGDVHAERDAAIALDSFVEMPPIHTDGS